MRYYLYILLFFIYSCELPDSGEHSGPLDYEDSITEGWSNFMDKDYEMAEELFLEALNSIPTYDSQALLGLGWTWIYHAKELTGADAQILFEERLQLRELAKERLLTAYDQMINYPSEAEIPYNFDLIEQISQYEKSSIIVDNNKGD